MRLAIGPAPPLQTVIHATKSFVLMWAAVRVIAAPDQKCGSPFRRSTSIWPQQARARDFYRRCDIPARLGPGDQQVRRQPRVIFEKKNPPRRLSGHTLRRTGTEAALHQLIKRCLARAGEHPRLIEFGSAVSNDLRAFYRRGRTILAFRKPRPLNWSSVFCTAFEAAALSLRHGF